ncbi:hypothetical protein [Microlunatus aurantiacus]
MILLIVHCFLPWKRVMQLSSRPTADPWVSRPKAEPEVLRPKAEPEVLRPKAEPEVLRPKAEPEVLRPKAEPVVLRPTAELVVALADRTIDPDGAATGGAVAGRSGMRVPPARG